MCGHYFSEHLWQSHTSAFDKSNFNSDCFIVHYLVMSSQASSLRWPWLTLEITTDYQMSRCKLVIDPMISYVACPACYFVFPHFDRNVHISTWLILLSLLFIISIINVKSQSIYFLLSWYSYFLMGS